VAFVLYHLVISPATTTHGVSNAVNVSVQVDSSLFGPPRIDDIGPLTGPTEGGTVVTITGDNLDGVTEVDLDDGLKCEPITHIDNSKLTCIMPPHNKGYVNVTVISPGYGLYTKDNGYRYLGDDNLPLPLPPNTSLFRLGDHIITSRDILTLVMTVISGVVVLWLIVWKRSHRRKADKSS
jgi:hypothetical protein